MHLRVIFLVLVAHLIEGNEIPSEIEKCRFRDNKCLLRSSNSVIRRFGKVGLKDIGLSPLNARLVDDVSLTGAESHGPFSLNIQLSDHWVYGLENTTITKIGGFDPDPTHSEVEIHARIPSLQSKLKLNLVSKFLNLNLNATGQMAGDFQNFRFIFKFTMTADAKGYVKLYKLDFNMKIDRWIQQLDNLFVNNTDLTIIVNDWVNKNWKEYWADFEPEVKAAMTAELAKQINKVLGSNPYNDFFL